LVGEVMVIRGVQAGHEAKVPVDGVKRVKILNGAIGGYKLMREAETTRRGARRRRERDRSLVGRVSVLSKVGVRESMLGGTSRGVIIGEIGVVGGKGHRGEMVGEIGSEGGSWSQSAAAHKK
jgi:hypothetical protein